MNINRFFLGLFLVTATMVYNLGYAGFLNNSIVDENAPEDAIVFLESNEKDITFAVWEDQVELYGEDVIGDDVVIPVDDIINTKLGGATLFINTDSGQISITLSGFGMTKARKAKNAIDALL